MAAKPKAKARVQQQLFDAERTADFICMFLDGPWAGQKVTYKRDLPKFEVGRLRRADEDGDAFFRYEPAAVHDVAGVKQTDYRLTYDGPIFIRGKHA